jgi:ferredoxin
VEAISVDECGKAVIDPALCINCGICAGSCPVSAIHPLNLEDCYLIGITPENDEIILQQGFEED